MHSYTSVISPNVNIRLLCPPSNGFLQDLEPLPSLMKSPVMSEQDLESCRRVVLDLQARENANEPLAVPCIGGRTKGVRRCVHMCRQGWKEGEVWGMYDLYEIVW